MSSPTTVDLVLRVIREGLLLVLLLSAPPLLASLLVGLVVGVLQAATQVQDQTVAFVPKLVVVVGCWWRWGRCSARSCCGSRRRC
jgi:flagellar biosynthesis protein FliQ